VTVAAHVTDEDTPQRCGEMTIPRVAVVKITEVKVMPLAKGYGKKSIGKNIKAERAAGKSKAQSIAISLNVARKAAKAAGKPSKGPKPPKGRKAKKK
jgi:hypothetical protein